jgi:hypothetical protein
MTAFVGSRVQLPCQCLTVGATSVAALDAVQIAAVVVATVLVFACVVGVQFAYRARTQSKGDGSRRSDSQLGFLEAESLLPQYPAAQLQGLQVLEEDPAEPPAPPPRASDISAQVGFGGPYSALQSDVPEPPPRASLRAADFATYTPPPVASYQVTSCPLTPPAHAMKLHCRGARDGSRICASRALP